MANTIIKVVILDDHALFRIGLLGILSSDPVFKVVGEYSSFDPLKPIIPTLDADLILIDVSLVEDSGIEVAKYIKGVNPLIKIIILSGHKEEFYVVSSLEANVNGYIHKDVEPNELITGIKGVMAGQNYFSHEIGRLLVNHVYNRPKGMPYLTQKEKEVVKYLLDGYSSKEIADILDVSPRTIESHRSNVLGKFKLKNTTELIKKIIEHKIAF